MRTIKFIYTILIFLCSFYLTAQTIQDNFEGNGNINNWFGDDCAINTSINNPFQTGQNTSSTSLRYSDVGGTFANVRFDAGRNLNLSQSSVFTFQIYVPSSSITGNQNNQVSLKLQDGTIGSPWTTQSEIIKPILLNQWQTVSFNFASDPFINLDPTSAPPIQRSDFNRVLIQVNGEGNSDRVIAYIDDFYYYDTTVIAPVYNQLIWSDEFNGTGALDPTKWFHQTQLPSGGSWFNGEIQHYTNRATNSYQANGYLNLVAKKETYTSQGHTKQYTSARLNSKFAFTYGRVEIMAQLPTGVGTWPALWTLGKNISEPGAYWQTQGFGNTAWPACGEIDIMEHWGSNQNFVQSAMHTPSSSGATVNHGGQVIPTASSNFHLYALEWTPNKMVFSVDGVIHYTYNPAIKNPSTWPYTADQFFLFNIAIQPSIAASFTQSAMLVDYIRVYKQGPVSIKENQQNQVLNIFPNPVRNQLNIQLSNGTLKKSAQISIHSILGKKIKENIIPEMNQNQITINDLNDLKPGLYFISITEDDRVYTIKFVKN